MAVIMYTGCTYSMVCCAPCRPSSVSLGMLLFRVLHTPALLLQSLTSAGGKAHMLQLDGIDAVADMGQGTTTRLQQQAICIWPDTTISLQSQHSVCMQEYDHWMHTPAGCHCCNSTIYLLRWISEGRAVYSCMAVSCSQTHAHDPLPCDTAHQATAVPTVGVHVGWCTVYVLLGRPPGTRRLADVLCTLLIWHGSLRTFYQASTLLSSAPLGGSSAMEPSPSTIHSTAADANL